MMMLILRTTVSCLWHPQKLPMMLLLLLLLLLQLLLLVHIEGFGIGGCNNVFHHHQQQQLQTKTSLYAIKIPFLIDTTTTKTTTATTTTAATKAAATAKTTTTTTNTNNKKTTFSLSFNNKNSNRNSNSNYNEKMGKVIKVQRQQQKLVPNQSKLTPIQRLQMLQQQQQQQPVSSTKKLDSSSSIGSSNKNIGNGIFFQNYYNNKNKNNNIQSVDMRMKSTESSKTVATTTFDEMKNIFYTIRDATIRRTSSSSSTDSTLFTSTSITTTTKQKNPLLFQQQNNLNTIPFTVTTKPKEQQQQLPISNMFNTMKGTWYNTMDWISEQNIVLPITSDRMDSSSSSKTNEQQSLLKTYKTKNQQQQQIFQVNDLFRKQPQSTISAATTTTSSSTDTQQQQTNAIYNIVDQLVVQSKFVSKSPVVVPSDVNVLNTSSQSIQTRPQQQQPFTTINSMIQKTQNENDTSNSNAMLLQNMLWTTTVAVSKGIGQSVTYIGQKMIDYTKEQIVLQQQQQQKAKETKDFVVGGVSQKQIFNNNNNIDDDDDDIMATLQMAEDAIALASAATNTPLTTTTATSAGDGVDDDDDDIMATLRMAEEAIALATAATETPRVVSDITATVLLDNANAVPTTSTVKTNMATIDIDDDDDDDDIMATLRMAEEAIALAATVTEVRTEEKLDTTTLDASTSIDTNNINDDIDNDDGITAILQMAEEAIALAATATEVVTIDEIDTTVAASKIDVPVTAIIDNNINNDDDDNDDDGIMETLQMADEAIALAASATDVVTDDEVDTNAIVASTEIAVTETRDDDEEEDNEIMAALQAVEEAMTTFSVTANTDKSNVDVDNWVAKSEVSAESFALTENMVPTVGSTTPSYIILEADDTNDMMNTLPMSDDSIVFDSSAVSELTATKPTSNQISNPVADETKITPTNINVDDSKN